MSTEASILARHRGNVTKAARELGIPRSTLRSRLKKSGAMASKNCAPALLSNPVGSSLVTVIGDAHDAPWQSDKSRFRHFGMHASDRRSDYIVQLGDIATFDSLNSHIENSSAAGKKKKPIFSDFLSLEAALDELNDGLGKHEIQRHLTKGNHEQRVRAFENAHPELEDILVNELDGIFEDRGWSHSPYGALHFIDGVAFTHVPLNKLGKPYGGKTSMLQIANDAMHDIVFGNSHNLSRVTIPKIGSSVTIVNAGCSLPQGHIEGYARHSLTGWWYGILDIVISKGRIASVSEVSIAELSHRYSR